MIAIRMPDFGTAVDEIRLVRWLVEEGAAVQRGDLLAEIETDKAASELEAAASGVLLRRVAAAGAAVASGTIIAYVGAPGEQVEESTPPAARLSPVVLNLARKLGVDPARVQGTGESGAITREDILRASRDSSSPPATPRATPLAPTQAAVARAVAASARDIPQFGISAVVDMTASERLRSRHGAGYDALFLKAMAAAAEAVPVLTARLEEDRLVWPDGIHIAVAVGAGELLQLPVIRDVNRKDLETLQAEVDALAAAAARGALPQQALAGACMSLSNLGMYPIESFRALVFPGQSAILAVGRVGTRPVVADDRVEVRPCVTVHLSADHRYINGRTAAEFVARLKEALES